MPHPLNFFPLDENGGAVVGYKHDARANHAILDASDNNVTSGVGVLNMFRHRSYRYDTEIGSTVSR